jgi:NADPH-dependent glutamate synthase beta subunit-like oxidoreductase
MEPISLLLDAFIRLAERIINLEKTKFQDQRLVFDEIIKPLFVELEPIAQNYLAFFRKARQLVVDKNRRSSEWGIEIAGNKLIPENIKNELQEMAHYMKEERDAMIMVRVKVTEMAHQIKERTKSVEMAEFADAVDAFFFNSPGNLPEVKLPRDSKATEFLEKLNQSISSDYNEKDLIKYIDRVLLKLENSWGDIARSYGKLRIQLVSPPKLLRKL